MHKSLLSRVGERSEPSLSSQMEQLLLLHMVFYLSICQEVLYFIYRIDPLDKMAD